MALHPYDLYDVRSLLSEEERAVQDTVARASLATATTDVGAPGSLTGAYAESLLTSSSPAPQRTVSHGVDDANGMTEVRSAASTSLGCVTPREYSRAAAAATCGVAIEVPLTKA